MDHGWGVASRISIPCQSCGQPTVVDLDRPYSSQRCVHCGEIAATGRAAPEPVKRRRVKRVAGQQGREKGWQDTPRPGRRQKRRWPAWLKVLTVVLVLVLTGGLSAVVIYRHYHTGEVVGKPPGDPGEPSDVRMRADFRERAVQTAMAVLAADSVEKLLPLMSFPGVTEGEVRQYYETEEKLPMGRTLVEDYHIPAGDFPHPLVQFMFQDREGRGRILAVMETPEGMRGDWPSLVAWGGMTLPKFLEVRPALPVVMRLRGKVGHYYNRMFSDRERWLCLRLSQLDSGVWVYAYLDRRHPLANEILATFGDVDDPLRIPDRPITARFRCPEVNQEEVLAEITDVVGLTWFLPEGIP